MLKLGTVPGMLLALGTVLLLAADLHAACPEACKCREKGVVDCSQQGLFEFPPELPDDTSTLILTGNNINNLRKIDLQRVPKLVNLILRNNKIQSIDEGILDEVPHLRRLLLARNKLRSLPRLSTDRSGLVSLELRLNNLNSIDRWAFANLPNLMQLDLTHNTIQTLSHDVFASNSRLSEVYLQHNSWNCDCRIKDLKKYFTLEGSPERSEKEAGCFFPRKHRGKLIRQMNEEDFECAKPSAVKDGENAILVCPAFIDGEEEVTWLENNMPINEMHQTLRMGPNGTLIVPKDTSTDAITCAVDKAIGTLMRDLRQIRAHHGKAPVFTFKQKPTAAREGDSLELSCEATGDPQPKIIWSFGNEELMSSTKYDISKGGAMLKIFPFLESDLGSYTCEAKNIHGKVEHTARVTLASSEPPVIFDAPASMTMEIGQQMTFRCNARGVPAPEVSWLFEGTRIPRRNTRFTISENNVELMVEKLTRHDAGVYTCHAVNSVGSTSAMATLKVSDAVTAKIDSFLNKDAVDQIANRARENIDRALSTTKESLARDKIDNPDDLRTIFKFASALKKVDLTKAREIYEESLRLIQDHINNGLNFTAAGIAPNVSYEAVLPVSYVQTLMEKSGCQTGQFVESCDDMCYNSKYRSYDGQCNNFEHPMWGVSEMAFLRLLPPRYENGFNTPVGWEHGRLYNGFPLPNARKISRELIGTDEITPHNHLSVMTMQWGQFIDHDLTLTAPALTRHSYREGAFCNRTCDNVDPCFNIQLDADDPKLLTAKNRKFPCLEFERNGAACGSGETSPIFQRVTYRDQLNTLTSYLDGSAIYGNTEEQALELRDLYSDHGLLRFDIVSEAKKPYLPFEKDSEMDCRRNYSQENPIRCFLGGDIRANEQLGLTAMHTVFLREHNRIAGKLLELNSNWDGEVIYQESRKILGAMMQHITYTEWLPKVLGRTTYNEIIGPYKGYNPEVNPTIANEFATAALRFAHTTINPQLFRFDKNFKTIKEGHIPLHKAFFAPERLLSEGGVDPLLRGLFAAPIKNPRPDQILNKELTEKLFSRYHEVALDLAAMNIQRSRDHGLPSWTEYRRFCNLSVPKTWEDMTPIVKNESVIVKLRQLYGVPENIDLWVGGVTEKRTSEALMGPTLACIIADQFRRLRDGDRFWYESEGTFTALQLRQIKKATLAKIVCENGDDIDRIQKDIFIYHGNSTTFYEPCSDLPFVNLNMWASCCDNTCQGSLSAPPQPTSQKRRRSVELDCKLVDGVDKRNGDRWMNPDDTCGVCTCKEGEIWCRMIPGCTARARSGAG